MLNDRNERVAEVDLSISLRPLMTNVRSFGDLQNINAFIQIRFTDNRQYLSSAAGFRTRINLSD